MAFKALTHPTPTPTPFPYPYPYPYPWQNGMAFNALINAFRPDLLNFESLKATNKLDNLNQVRGRGRG